MKQKRLIALLLVLVLLFGLVACSSSDDSTSGDQANDAGTTTPDDGAGDSTSGGETSGEDAEDAAEPDYSMYEVTEPVTIEFWYNYTNEDRVEWLEKAIDEFNASQDLITVEGVYIGGYPVIAEQVAGALAAGTGLPALSTINYPRVLNFSGSGVAEPLNEYFAAAGSDSLDDYFDGMVDGLSSADGTIYGVPFAVSSGICIYNQTVLDEIGKPFPETWEEFKVWCKEVHEATGKIAFAFPYDFNYMNNFFINVTGIDPLGDGTVSVLDDPKILDFVYDMKELVDAGYCSWVGSSINNAQDEQLPAFVLGEIIAYTDTTSGLVKAIDGADFEVNSAVGVTGTDQDAITTASGAALVIYAGNDQMIKNAAFQFAIFLSNAENIAEWAVDTCMYPVRKSVLESGALDALYENYPGAKNTFDRADKVVGKNKSTAMQSCMEMVVDTLGQILKGNVTDIEGAWATLKEEVDYELADALSGS